MGAIYKRELKAAFTGMTGPIFIAYVLIFMGFYAVSVVLQGLSPHFEYVILYAGFFSLLAVPVLTMRSLPEERHNKTDQLLFSLPITTLDIVLGKYLAMVTVFAVPVVTLSLYPLVSLMFVTEGSLNFLTIYGTILCYFLLGCAVIGICMFLSSMTESQVISAIVNIAALILIYMISGVASLIPQSGAVSLFILLVAALAVGYIVWLVCKNVIVGASVGGVLAVATVVTYVVKAELFDGLARELVSKLTLFEAIDSFAYGVLDVTAILYYLSIACLFVFLTVQSVEKRRWS